MDEESELILMRVLTTKGQRLLWVPEDSDESSVIGSHWNVIKRFRDKGNKDDMEGFKDVTITGADPDSPDPEHPVWLTFRLASDPDQIKKWAKQGELDEADPYSELNGDGNA